jgi:predicted nucleotidyltransferase
MRFFKDTRGIRHRNNRPHGRLPEENKLEEMQENANEYASKLSKYPEVLGVTLTGGLSRGYADDLSEIDLNVYLSDEPHRLWTLGKGPIPHGDHLGTKYHMDVNFLNYQKESEEKWDVLKKWDASYTKVLYDPEGKIEKLLNSKDMFKAEEKYRLALDNYLNCVYFGDIAVKQWILRGDPLVANQMVSKAIPPLCILLFLANDEYPPFEKWLINYSHSLQWKPEDWEKRLVDVTLIKELTLDEAKRRSTEFMKLYREVWSKVVGEEYSETGLLELDTLDTVEYVIENTPTLEEFTQRYGLNPLGYEVLYKLTEIEQRGDQEVIMFNKEKFLEEKKAGFPSFLDWNKEMLSHIKLPRS